MKEEILLEVKINREIRDYTETMFFGLSVRQFFFSLMAVGVAVTVFLLLKPLLGTETVSWICMLAAAPFAAMGFVKYHGMNAEQFIWAWLKSEVIEPRQLPFESLNYYYGMLGELTEKERKEVSGNDGKINEECACKGQGTV